MSRYDIAFSTMTWHALRIQPAAPRFGAVEHASTCQMLNENGLQTILDTMLLEVDSRVDPFFSRCDLQVFYRGSKVEVYRTARD